MKKKLILFLLLSTPFIIFSQDDFRKLGIGVGYSTSSIVGDSVKPFELSFRYRLDRKHTFQFYVPFYQNQTVYDFGYSKTIKDRLIGLGIGYDYSFYSFSNFDIIAGVNADYRWFENREDYHAMWDEYKDNEFIGKMEDRSLLWKRYKGFNLSPNTGIRFSINKITTDLKFNLLVSHISRKRYFNGKIWNHTLMPEPLTGWEEPSVYTIYYNKLQGYLSLNLSYYF